MIFRSIRSRLALSFAGIALVAALALGAVLLVILQRYYVNQELIYLRGNAQAVSGLVMGMMSSNAPHDELQSQIDNLSFLSQTRIQVYDPNGKLLFDSGSRGNVNQLSLGVVKQVAVAQSGEPPKNLVFITVAGPQSQTAPVQAPPAPNAEALPGPGGSVFVYRSVQAGSSPFGFQLRVNPDGVSTSVRSGLSIVDIVRDPKSSSEIGTVKLSEGPAYGSEVLRSVALGWLVASAAAVLLAALIGWFISRRISAPVVALTEATTRMARGDLTSRASVQSHDEIGRLGRSFNEMADQVEATVTTLRQFLSDASHELRTPLTALRTNVDLAVQEQDAQERQTFLERAQAMVERLEELNGNLLDLSRLEANGHAREMQTLDLAGVLRARVEIYASQAEQAGLALDASVPAARVLVLAEASQITRAMDNLVDNACKFTSQGGMVYVGLSEQDGLARFSVRDSGIGIPADDLPQIFNRFHRGRNTSGYPGSGLGLAIVKAIVVAHGGHLEAHSEGEGQGSEFAIALPMVASGKEIGSLATP